MLNCGLNKKCVLLCPLQKLRTHLQLFEAGREPWRIVRVIPNTPIMVGAGATGNKKVILISLKDVININQPK